MSTEFNPCTICREPVDMDLCAQCRDGRRPIDRKRLDKIADILDGYYNGDNDELGLSAATVLGMVRDVMAAKLGSGEL